MLDVAPDSTGPLTVPARLCSVVIQVCLQAAVQACPHGCLLPAYLGSSRLLRVTACACCSSRLLLLLLRGCAAMAAGWLKLRRGTWALLGPTLTELSVFKVLEVKS
jgi:hypothetical protein